MHQTADMSNARTNRTAEGHNSPGLRRWKIVLLAAMVLAGMAASFLLPVRDWLVTALRWIDGLGPWSAALVIAIYVLACVLLLPGSVLTLGAGFLYGVLWATMIVSIASTLGATAAFLIGRYVARGWVSRKVAQRPGFQAVDDALGREGFKIVLLTRLSPIFPFNFLNYAFGVTQVPLWKFVLASWLGMIPGTIMYVYFGSVMGSFAQVAAGRSEKSPVEWIFFGAGLVIAVGVTLFVTRLARRALKQEVALQPRAAPCGGDAS